MRHMPRYDDWIRATPEERMRLARINVRENPLLVPYKTIHEERLVDGYPHIH